MLFRHPTDMCREGANVPVIREQIDDNAVLRLQGACNVTGVAEIKTLALEALATGKALRVDLEQAEEIDISILQLLWAIGREAARTHATLVVSATEPVRLVAREAGFAGFPGETVEG
jgi:anti-anti-sigma regulatory factor